MTCKSNAQRIVDYDLMKIVVNFHAKEDTSDMASKRVMKECEDFLAQLKKGGFDLSAVSLVADQIRQTYSYRNDEQAECYEANRELEFVCEFNMKLINDIRIITNRMKSKANFKESSENSRFFKCRDESAPFVIAPKYKLKKVA